MKRRMKITDLNFDVLKHIMFCVAASSDGAVNFAKAICVCKTFNQFAEEASILTTTNFCGVKLPAVGGSFWKVNGLLNRCACAGNLTALCVLLKNFVARIRSEMTLITVTYTIEMDLRMGSTGRYCTRAKMRAAKPYLKVITDIILSVEADHAEIQEIVEMMQGIKSSLLLILQQATLPKFMVDYYGQLIEFIPELKDIAFQLIDVIARFKDMFLHGPVYGTYVLPFINN